MSTASAAAPRAGRGTTLVEALAALLIVGLVAIASVGLTHRSIHALRRAERVDTARSVAGEIVRELASVPWHAFRHHFGLADAATSARLGTDDGTAPSSWAELASRLPGGRVVVELESLGTGGGAEPLASALAFRLTIRVSRLEREGDRRETVLRVVRP